MLTNPSLNIVFGSVVAKPQPCLHKRESEILDKRTGRRTTATNRGGETFAKRLATYEIAIASKLKRVIKRRESGHVAVLGVVGLVGHKNKPWGVLDMCKCISPSWKTAAL